MSTSNTKAAGGTIWAFDLGKGSIGEAVRQGNDFLHKASLLISAEFVKEKTGEDSLAGFTSETLFNRCIRLAASEPVCVI